MAIDDTNKASPVSSTGVPTIDIYPPKVKLADNNIDDLFDHFSGKTDDVKSDADINNVFDHFSAPPQVASQAAVATPLPQEVHPPISGVTPQQSDTLNAQFEQADAFNKANPETIGDAALSSIELPVQNLWKNTKENFEGGRNLYTQGGKQFLSNQPASGLPNIALGLAAMAASPLSGLADTFIRDPVTQLTGNPDIGNRAEMVATSGLPIAKGGQLAINALPTNRAVAALVNRIGVDNLPAALARMQDDPTLSLADVSPAVRQMTQKLVTTEGAPQNQIEQWVKQRAAAAKGNVEGAFNNTMGMPVNVLTKLRDLKKAASDVGTKFIQPSLSGAGPVDVSGVISDIDNTLKPGVNSVVTVGKQLPSTPIKEELKNIRDLLTNDQSVRTDPNDLHTIQSNLRAKADDLINSSSGSDRQMGYALMDTRNKIVNAIDAASPQVKDVNGNMIGTYKTGLSKYRDEKQIEDAFIKGNQITKNRPGVWDDRPEFWEDWVKNASPQEIEAAKEGARLAVDQQINGMKFGARKGTDIPDIQFNKDKLSSLFGTNEIDTMSKQLQNQKDIADTNSKLIQNSQTAMRLKADSEVDLPKPTKDLPLSVYLAPLAEAAGSFYTGTPGVSLAMLAGAKGAVYVKNKIAMGSQLSKNNALSKLITSTGSDRDDLIKTLSKYIPQQKPSMLQRVRNVGLPILPP